MSDQHRPVLTLQHHPAATRGLTPTAEARAALQFAADEAHAAAIHYANTLTGLQNKAMVQFYKREMLRWYKVEEVTKAALARLPHDQLGAARRPRQ